MASNQIISVFFQGIELGKIGYDEDRRQSSFQYNPAFLEQNKLKNIFPYLIKRVSNVQIFSQYEGDTFRGLNPIFADSLPDDFGNLVFKKWLESKQLEPRDIDPIEQLSYVGNRGMGALEYIPHKNLPFHNKIHLEEIIEITQKVLDVKQHSREQGLTEMALLNIFKIGTSAGGARPKVIVSEHKTNHNLVPGDLVYSDDYNHYLIKLSLDVNEGYSKEKIEFIYYQIATQIGIEMMPSKLINDKHFATLRFDRQQGKKFHTLTTTGLTGWDYKKAEHSSYENLFRLVVDLKLPHKDIEQLFRRMVFNLVFANIDDHLKNFSFIYDEGRDKWNLAPAYDLTYPLDALLNYTKVSRALSLNGKRTEIIKADLLSLAENFTIKNPNKIIDEVTSACSLFRSLAIENEIPEKVIHKIESEFKYF